MYIFVDQPCFANSEQFTVPGVRVNCSSAEMYRSVLRIIVRLTRAIDKSSCQLGPLTLQNSQQPMILLK